MPATFPFRRMEARVWPPSLVLTFRPVQYASPRLLTLRWRTLPDKVALGGVLSSATGPSAAMRVEALEEEGAVLVA